MDAVVYYRLNETEKKYHAQHTKPRDFHTRFEDFYSFVKRNGEFDLLLARNKLFHVYEDLIRDDFSTYMTVQRDWIIDGFLRKYLPDYLSSTLVSLLQKWMETGYAESPKQMADITANLMEGYLSIHPQRKDESQDPSASPSGSFNRNDMKAQELPDVLDNLPVGVCVLFMPDDAHQEIRLANKEQMRLINPAMSAPDKVSPQLNEVRLNYYKNAFSGVHPDDLAMSRDIFRRGFHQKRFRVPQIRLRTSSGDYIWVAMDVTLRETLPDGRLFYAVYRNISQEVALRGELDQQKKKNVEKTILDTIGHLPASSVLYREHPEGKLVLERCSEEMLDFIGYAKNEFLDAGKIDLLKSIHPEDRDAALKEFHSRRGKSSSLRYIMFRIKIRGDGYKWVRANYSWFSFSEEKYLYIVCTDINDLKIQEQKLKQQYKDAQAFLDSVSESYLMTQRADLSLNTVEKVRGKGALVPYFRSKKYDAFAKKIMMLLPTEEDRDNCREDVTEVYK